MVEEERSQHESAPRFNEKALRFDEQRKPEKKGSILKTGSNRSKKTFAPLSSVKFDLQDEVEETNSNKSESQSDLSLEIPLPQNTKKQSSNNTSTLDNMHHNINNNLIVGIAIINTHMCTIGCK